MGENVGSVETNGWVPKFHNKTRFIVLILSMFTLALVVSNTLTLNFTIICMKKTANSGQSHDNATSQEDYFSLTERGALFSATAIGAAIGTIPMSTIIANYGFRKSFALYGLLNAFATLLIPLIVPFGVVPVFITRVCQGLAYAISFVAIGTISTEWSPLKTSGMFIALISCNFQMGPIIVMPTAGFLCETLGWQYVYYFLGSLSLAVIAFFIYFFRDSPRFQRNVSAKELLKIEKGKSQLRKEKNEKQSVPYLAIFKDPMVWGTLASIGSEEMSFYFVSQFGPTYLNKALKISVEKTGLIGALPFAISIIVKFLIGPISDALSFISEKKRVILFSTICQISMAFCFFALAILSEEHSFLIQIMFSLIVVFGAFNTVGAIKGAQLATLQYCHVLLAWSSMVASIIALLFPIPVVLLVPDNTVEQWRRIFVGMCAVVISAYVLFILTVQVEPRPWTKEVNARKGPAIAVVHHIDGHSY